MTVNSNGTGELEINQISDPGAPFELIGGSCLALPLQLLPSESCDIEVEFAPEGGAAGEFVAQFDIVSNSESSPDTVTLRGTVSPPLAVPALGPLGPLGLIVLMLLLGGLAWLGLQHRAAANG